MLNLGLKVCRLACLTMCVMLFAGPIEASDHQKNILFVNPGYEDRGFWKAVTDTMRAAGEHFGYQIEVVNGERKWPLMTSRGLDAIKTTSADYIILVNEHQQAPILMQAAEDREIPYVLLLNSLTKEQEAALGGPREKLKYWLGTITPDNEVAGYEMALSLAEKASDLGLQDDNISLLTLAGDFKTPASISRLAGLERALAELPSLVEVRRMTVNWSEQEAYDRTKIYLQATTIDAIWAANDNIAKGAIRAVREAGKVPGKDVVVSGLNWSSDGIRCVIDGIMTLTHGGHFLAGAWGIIVLHDYEKGQDFADISKHLSFPMSAITKDNARTYLKHFGDEDWSKINFSSFSRTENRTLREYSFNLKSLLRAVVHD